MENTVYSYTSATTYTQNLQQQEFEAHLCASADVLAEFDELHQCLFKYVNQLLTDIPDTDLYNDNHLKHTGTFVLEVRQQVLSLPFNATKALFQSTYGEDYTEEYFVNALMKVLDELELCHDYTFINNSPIWIDQLSDFCLKQTSLLCKDGIWDTTKALRFVCYKMPSIFQKEYTVSNTVLEQALSKFEVSPKDILIGSRMLHDMANVESLFQGYDPTVVSIEQIDKYVELAGYVELPHHLYYLAEQAKKLDRWDLWITLWDKLQHPILQDSLLWSCKPLSLIDDKLRAALQKCKNIKSSIYLYFHHWLKSRRDSFANLYTFAECYGWLAQKLREAGIDAKANAERESLEKSFPEECNSLFVFLEGNISPSEIVYLVSDIRSFADVQESITQKIYEFTRNSLIDELCNKYRDKRFKVEGQPLTHLLILARIALESTTPDTAYLGTLWEAVESHLFAEKFYWNETITTPQQHNMFLVAQLFIATHPYRQNEINEYIDLHKVCYEGWGVKDISHRSDLCRAECYMLCVFLMSLLTDGYYSEEAAKEQQLLSIAKHAILQDKSCYDSVLCSAYQRAVLLLAKCIASQKLTSSNPKLDKILIEQIDNFVDMSEILINSTSVLSSENKTLFKARYDREWESEKQFLQSHPQRRNLVAIEKGLDTLLS